MGIFEAVKKIEKFQKTEHPNAHWPFEILGLKLGKWIKYE